MDTNKLMQIWIVLVYSRRAAAEPVKNGLFQRRKYEYIAIDIYTVYIKDKTCLFFEFP